MHQAVLSIYLTMYSKQLRSLSVCLHQGADSATQHTTAKPTAIVAKTNANTATNTNPASITNMFRARSGSELAAEGYGQGLTGNASEAKYVTIN